MQDIAQPLTQLLENLIVQDLRTDMEMNPYQANRSASLQMKQHFIQLTEIDTEFIFFHSGSNVVMRMRINFRINTQSDGSDLIFLFRKFVNHRQFRNRLNIKTKNILI